MRIFFTLFALIITLSLNADTLEASTMKEVFDAAGEIDPQTLIVFDVDETLTTSENPIFQRPNILKNRHLYKDALKILSGEQKTLFQSLSLTTADSSLIEPSIPGLISRAQKQGAKAIALTAALPKTLNGIDLVAWRQGELKRLGIDFSASFSKLQPFTLSQLNPMYHSYPTYSEGVIYANGSKNSKGEVLGAFLDTVDFVPSKIVFVDDKVENVIAVSEEMQKKQIPVIAIKYTGAKRVKAGGIAGEDELIKELMKLVNLALVTHNELVMNKE